MEHIANIHPDNLQTYIEMHNLSQEEVDEHFNNINNENINNENINNENINIIDEHEPVIEDIPDQNIIHYNQQDINLITNTIINDIYNSDPNLYNYIQHRLNNNYNNGITDNILLMTHINNLQTQNNNLQTQNNNLQTQNNDLMTQNNYLTNLLNNNNELNEIINNINYINNNNITEG